MRLDDRLVVIAGGGGALGQALATLLQSKTNARVYILDRDQGSLDRMAESLSRYPNPAMLRCIDLEDALARQKFLDEMWAKEKRVDVWINALGYNDVRPFSELDAGAFQKIMDINFNLPAACTREVFSRMLLETSGRIVNVASVAGLVPSVYMSAYVAAKHALVGLTRSLEAEIEFLGLGPKTLLVLPGFFESQ